MRLRRLRGRSTCRLIQCLCGYLVAPCSRSLWLHPGLSPPTYVCSLTNPCTATAACSISSCIRLPTAPRSLLPQPGSAGIVTVVSCGGTGSGCSTSQSKYVPARKCFSSCTDLAFYYAAANAWFVLLRSVMPVCLSVCLSLSHVWAVQKRLNSSRSCLWQIIPETRETGPSLTSQK